MTEVKDELYSRILAVFERWPHDPFEVADIAHSLGVGYKRDAPTKAQIKARLDRIATQEPGYSSWKVGNRRFYGKLEG